MKKADQLLSLFGLVLKRLVHHAGLSFSAWIGILSVLSLVVCAPIFAKGVLTRVLQSQLVEKAATNRRALFSLHIYYRDNEKFTPLTVTDTQEIATFIHEQVEQNMGLRVNSIETQVTTRQIGWSPIKVASSKPMYLNLGMLFFNSDLLKSKLKLVEGVWPENVKQAEPNDPIPVVVQEDYADQVFLNVGDIYEGDGIRIQVVGVVRALDPRDAIWFYDPQTTFRNAVWVPQDDFTGRLATRLERPISYVSWYVVVDDPSLDLARSLSYTRQILRLENGLRQALPGVSIDYSPLDMLQAYDARLNAMMVLFYAASAPVLALALLFIGLTASIAVRQVEQETAVMGARGGSPAQLVALNLIESLALIILALPGAWFVGWGAARLMAHTRLFMQFSNQADFTFLMSDVNVLWLGLTALAVILARLAPLLGRRHPSILNLKQERARTAVKPFWERFYLDLFLLAPAVYAYFSLRSRINAALIPGARLTPEFGEGAKVSQAVGIVSGTSASGDGYDPLMFLASSLCAIALCMLALRLFPLLLRLLGAIAARLHNAWVYLAVQEIARNPRDHASANLLIMIALSFSIFTASMARTLDGWLRDAQYYQVGADLAVKEYEFTQTGAEANSTSAPAPGSARAVESLVSLQRHIKLPEIQGATYVGKWQGRFSYGSEYEGCMVMGIDRLTFPDTAYYRRDFADPSLGALMNALAPPGLGVLIPESLAKARGLLVGDSLKMEAAIGVAGEVVVGDLTVVGFYRYFPTIYPGDQPTLITTLDTLFGGLDTVTGVDVWLKLKSGADTASVLENLRSMAVRDWLTVDVHGNALDAVRKATSEPEWVGLFGVLNIGFLLTGFLPGIGFILYSFASLNKRQITFGLLQALGLSTAQMEGSVALEQILMMIVALAGGAGVGLGVSALFLPLLQAGFAGAAPTPPFAVQIGWSEAGWLCLGFASIFIITLAVMMVILARLKIIQVMKLGEAV